MRFEMADDNNSGSNNKGIFVVLGIFAALAILGAVLVGILLGGASLVMQLADRYDITESGAAAELGGGGQPSQPGRGNVPPPPAPAPVEPGESGGDGVISGDGDVNLNVHCPDPCPAAPRPVVRPRRRPTTVTTPEVQQPQEQVARVLVINRVIRR